MWQLIGYSEQSRLRRHIIHNMHTPAPDGCDNKINAHFIVMPHYHVPVTLISGWYVLYRAEWKAKGRLYILKSLEWQFPGSNNAFLYRNVRSDYIFMSNQSTEVVSMQRHVRDPTQLTSFYITHFSMVENENSLDITR